MHFKTIISFIPRTRGSKFALLRHHSIASKETLDVSCATAATDKIQTVLDDVLQHRDKYGYHSEYFSAVKKRRILLEYSSPNIAKIFHAGHYRSTVVGNAISNILECAGHNLHRMNYLGDWGIQFALLSVGFRMFGDQKLLEKYPLIHLFDVYVKVSAAAEKDSGIHTEAQSIFKKMEDGDADSLEFWKNCSDISVADYKKRYAEMGIHFDSFTGESFYVQAAKKVIKRCGDLDLLQPTDGGAYKVNLSSASWLKSLSSNIQHPIIAKSNGTTLYLSRDVASAIDRFERYELDELIYVTDSSQRNHFLQVFSTLELLGYEWAGSKTGKVKHVGFGRIDRMKTRKGEVTFLHNILNQAKDKVRLDRKKHDTRKRNLENEDDVHMTLAMSGLICHDLKSSLKKSYKFSWDTALATKGNSGLFLQYTHCRLCSLERNSSERLNLHPSAATDIDAAAIQQRASLLNLLLHVSKYPDTCQSTYRAL